MAILKELKLKNIYLIIPAVLAVLIVFFAAQEDEEIPELSIEQSSINLEVSIEKNKHSSFYTVEEGDSMSVIFEENKVPLNLTYRILRGPHKNDFANKVFSWCANGTVKQASSQDFAASSFNMPEEVGKFSPFADS